MTFDLTNDNLQLLMRSLNESNRQMEPGRSVRQ